MKKQKKLRSAAKQLNDRISSAGPRKIIIAIAAVLCFLLPTILALSLILADDSEYTADSLSVTLFDSERVLIAEETASPDPEKHNSLVDIFYHIITSSVSSGSAPFSPDGSTPMYASIVYNGDHSEYTCYFSLTDHSSYYVDEAGNIFIISFDKAKDFLSSPYAESLYSKASPPKLYTNAGLTVVPSTASWFYRLKDDNYREALNYQTTSTALSYDFSETLGLSFEDDPDSCLVRVFENGSLIYEGSRAGLSDLTIADGAALRMSVTAKWDEHDGVLFHGEVSYSFNAVLRDRAEFSLNSDTIENGGFIVLTCTNISDVSRIRFVSDTLSTPTFSVYNDNVIALIKQPKNSSNKQFEFTITYGASSKHFDVKLGDEKSVSSYTLSTNKKEVLDAMSETSFKELYSIIDNASSHTSDTVYFRGNFSSPLTQGFSEGYTYGNSVVSSGGEKAVTAFGNEYLSTDGSQSIKALCSGKVIAVGQCSALGNYVAVDHGLGLISWYCHLSSLDTCADKTLALNDYVGKSGDGGFADGNGVLIFFTLNGEFLDPSFLISQRPLA